MTLRLSILNTGNLTMGKDNISVTAADNKFDKSRISSNKFKIFLKIFQIIAVIMVKTVPLAGICEHSY